MDADVLVVGAGPAGLMLANQSWPARIRAAVVDRNAGPALQTRALGVVRGIAKLSDSFRNLRTGSGVFRSI